jgi:hypothetical protein
MFLLPLEELTDFELIAFNILGWLEFALIPSFISSSLVLV